MSVKPEEELVKEWEREQAELKQRLQVGDTEDWQTSPCFTGLERVGGVDLSFIKGDDINACAQLVVLSYPDMKLLYQDSQMVALDAPYVAGFLAFRETPSLLHALRRLQEAQPSLMPQVVFVDGNGLFHYREFGLACHLGVLSGLPCIGVAKNLLQVQGVVRDEQHLSQINALQRRRHIPPDLPIRERAGKGPAQLRLQHQTRVCVGGPPHQSGRGCTPHSCLLPLPRARAHQTG
ncbi:endonuclease V-like [Alosa alosa]|uniref:endonuclease V-like n=1 Tax=Alosa alosa TaxID=278164 RepID=UPI00201507EA|nr:endonuclease V-like [Alosa alosa]